MDFKEHTVREATSTRKSGGKITDMAGWEEVGSYASCAIYASGDMRHLIDRETGALIVQYRFSQKGEGEK